MNKAILIKFTILLFSFGLLVVLPRFVYGEEPVLEQEQIEPQPTGNNSNIDLSSDSDPLRMGTFTVDSTGDQSDAVLDGLCATSVGECTLRAAAEEAVADNTQDRIIFNIPTNDSGFTDHDGGLADMVGGDDYWVINYQGSSNDLFNSAIVLDVWSQTNNQGNTNASGPEIMVNFSSSPTVQGASISPEVLGASTPQSHTTTETFYYLNKYHNPNNRDWYIASANGPSGLTDLYADADGTIWLGESSYGKIYHVDNDGYLIDDFPTNTIPGGLTNIGCIKRNGNYIYICQNNFSSSVARVVWFDLDGNYVGASGTFGSGLGQFNAVTDLAIDSSGNFYILDGTLRRVQKFDSNWNYLLTWGSSGTGNGQFGSGAQGLDVDSNANVFVADQGNARVQKFDSGGNYVLKWGSSGSGNGQFTFVRHVEVGYDDYVYTADNGQQATQRFTNTGVFVAKWGATHGGNFDTGNYNHLTVGPDDKVYINSNEQGVIIADIAGTYLDFWGIRGLGTGLSAGIPQDVLIDDSGYVYMSNLRAPRKVIKIAPDFGSAIELPSCPGTAPNALAKDSQGNIYVSHTALVCKYDSSGGFLTSWSTLHAPDVSHNIGAIVVDNSDNIWLMDIQNESVKKYTNTGTLLSRFTGGIGTGNGQFGNNGPRGIAMDNDGNIWVSDFVNDRVTKFTQGGSFILKIGDLGSGDTQFNNPLDIHIDSEGNIWVLDQSNNKLKQFDTDGNWIRTISISFNVFPPLTNAQGMDIGSDDKFYITDIRLNGVAVLSFDSDAPEVTINPITNNETTETSPSFTGYITDTVSPITAIWYTVDDGLETTDCLVADNVIDEREEEFTCYIADELSSGEHTITVYGEDSDEQVGSSEYTFTVLGAAAETPPEEPAQSTYEFDLVYPINGIVIEDNTPKFNWEDIDSASELDFYDLYINNKFVKNTGLTSEYQVTDEDALPNGEYTWQVLAYKFEDGEATEIGRSVVESFSVNAPVSAEPEEPVTPPETGEKPTPERPRPTAPSLPDFVTNISNFKAQSLVPAAGIVAATATVALSTTLLTAGKDVLEKLGFVIGGIVPKKRKYWGIVFDGVKSQGIPFAVVRVYDNNKKLINTTVTDLDGRYGIPVSQSGRYYLEVKAKGFKPFAKNIILSNGELQEIVENIAMERAGRKLDPFRSFFFYHMSEMLLVLRLLILFFMVAGFLYSLYLFVEFPILLNLLIFALYMGLFILNLYQEFKHRRNVEGRVIDLDARIGVPSTTVILYNSKGDQEDVRLTNAKGVAKLRAKSGTYKVQALKSSYKMSELTSGQSSLELKVDERGYLTKAIFLTKS